MVADPCAASPCKAKEEAFSGRSICAEPGVVLSFATSTRSGALLVTRTDELDGVLKIPMLLCRSLPRTRLVLVILICGGLPADPGSTVTVTGSASTKPGEVAVRIADPTAIACMV